MKFDAHAFSYRSIPMLLIIGLLLYGCAPSMRNVASPVPLPTRTNTPVKITMVPTPIQKHISDVALLWMMTEKGDCQQVEVTDKTVAIGICGEPGQKIDLMPERAEELAFFFDTYASFEVETKRGEIAFVGEGSHKASDVEQRSVAEWAYMVFLDAKEGHQGTDPGLAITWHREGGIAGFCDDINVYMSGWAASSSCRPGQSGGGRSRLSEAELKKLYAWIDEYQSFTYDNKDPAVADAMEIKVIFSGEGDRKVTSNERDEIAAFASGLNRSPNQ